MAAVATLGRRGRGGFAYDRGFRWFAVAPALTLLLLISLFPVAYNVVISLKGITLADADGGFVGLANFVRLGSDARFWESDPANRCDDGRAGRFPGSCLSVALAVFLHRRDRGKRWFVALLVLPAMISPIVAGETWRLRHDTSYGPIDQVLGWISGHSVGILWVVDENYVFPAIAIVEIWEHTPFASCSHSRPWKRWTAPRWKPRRSTTPASGWTTAFWRIVLPAIWPVLAMIILIRALDLMRL